ncbi:hypothetical protein [Candidatus Ferrigenium straubiae]|jgi:hypothetical protein|uniref:hypothetical protein n=1 Tax=Candidatus Ferrigenium straubiae TaxID=2919506 RepID=UPI003F4AA33D
MSLVSPALLAATAPKRLRRHRVAAAPDMAMAGGTQPEHLAAALASVTDWVKARL